MKAHFKFLWVTLVLSVGVGFTTTSFANPISGREKHDLLHDFLDLRKQVNAAGAVCAELLEPVLHAIVEDHSNKPVTLLSSESHRPVHRLALGSRMGRGFFGSVYRVPSALPMEFLNPVTALYGEAPRKFPSKMTIKLPHSLADFEWAGPMAHAKDSQQRELLNYEFIMTQVPVLEGDPMYPQII